MIVFLMNTGSISAEKTVEERYIESAKALDRSNRLLSEERQRWKNLHGNPPPDQVEFVPGDREILMRVTIDSGVKNAVNGKPITREYRLDVNPDRIRIVTKADVWMLGSAVYREGILPGVAVGWRPFGKGWPAQELAPIGFSAYWNILSAGGSAYYVFPSMPTLSLHVLFGVNVSGQICPGVAVGLIF